jgi:hypothetical protein
LSELPSYSYSWLAVGCKLKIEHVIAERAISMSRVGVKREGAWERERMRAISMSRVGVKREDAA